jgi:TPR repeat protein
VTKDVNKAYQLAYAGAQVGCHHCKGALACCLVHGWGTERDADQGLKLAKESLFQGSKYGNYMWGYCLLGLGNIDEAVGVKHCNNPKQDSHHAGLYLSAASDLGLVEAHNELAFAYQSIDAFRDLSDAYRLYCQAADFGHPAAIESAGYCLLRGVGTHVDIVAAARHLKVAAESGCIGALRLLLECEDASRDTSADKVRATLQLWQNQFFFTSTLKYADLTTSVE